MYNNNVITKAVRLAMIFGAGSAAVASSSVLAAEDEAKKIEKIEVTGSRLQRTDMESALPVAVISREDILATGDVSVGEILRNFPGNSQGSFTPRAGSSAQSTAGINLRGLGSNRTLVLVNGKRLPSDALGGGSGQNLSLIPSAMIERIEILKDGASSIYGSEAIAGVVNIILRKDFEGLQFSSQIGRPSRDGGGEEEQFSLVGGFANDSGNITFAVEHKEISALSASDRAITAANTDGFVGYSTNSDPANYRVTDFFNDGTGVNGPWQPDSRCDSALIQETPRIRTHPTTGEVVNVVDRECSFPFADVAVWLPSFTTDSIFINTNYNVNDDLTVYAQTSAVKLVSNARYAPIPLVSGFGLTVDKTDPLNPTFGTDNPQDVGVKWRPQALGNRDFIVETLQLDFLSGFTWSNDYGSLDGYVQWNKQSSDDTTRNLVLFSSVFDLIEKGEINPFGSSESVAAAADKIRADSFREASVDLFVSGLNWSGDLPFAELPGGLIAYSLGWEFRSEDFSETYDPLTTTGAIFGGTGGPSGGGRDSRSGFFELAFPVTDELVVTYAGRYDEYTLPKDASEYTQSVRLRYQATEDLVLRASYSEGFRVPGIDTLLQSGGVSTDQAIDRLACNASGDANSPLCQAGETSAVRRPGAETQPERSESYAAGVVWNATEDLSLTVDWWSVEIIDEIKFLSTQAVLDLEATGVDPTTFNVDVKRDGQNEIIEVVNGFANLPGFDTSGIDFNINYSIPTDSFGDFKVDLNGTYVIDYNNESAPGLGVFDNVGFVSSPELLAVISLGWNMDDFSANIGINYNDGYDARTPEDTFLNNVGAEAGTLGSFTTIDMSASYILPTDTRVTLGARNIGDKISTPNNFAFGNGIYDRGLGEILGRVVYVNVTHNF
jgi:iron complex outermembrane receptor protein